MQADRRAILEALKKAYPEAKPELNFSNPYETLVAVMLSAQCTDKQVNKVTPAVFRDFPTVQDMASTDASTLYPYVKSCGFKSKSANIVAACQKICSDFGGVVPSTMEELTSLPGVGRKTANVVMSTAFGKPAIAVDTHVFRVSNRLGLADADNVYDTEMQLCACIPTEDWSAAHHWLIWHGRRVCSARNPACDTCPLASLCRDRLSRSSNESDTGSTL